MSSLKLPNELIDLIIDHLHNDKPMLEICALVCRGWVAPSRFHLFRRISVLPDGVGEFTSLCDSPFSTIPRANTHSLVFCPGVNNPALNRLLTWRSVDGQKTLAAILSQLRTLELSYVGWWTLSAPAKKILAQFQSLRELTAFYVVFETRDQFFTLLGAFPNLEILTLSDCSFQCQEAATNPGDPNLNAALPPRLHTIRMRGLGHRGVAVVDAIALLPCHSLRAFDFSVSYFPSADLAYGAAAAIGKLVASAGQSLEAFSAEVKDRFNLSDGTDLYGCFELIDLTKNTSLQRIGLHIKDNRRVLPFLGQLADATISSKFFIPTLQSLKIEDLPTLLINWDALDVLLQHPYFSALSELKYSVTAPVFKEDVRGQPLSSFTGVPNWGSNAHKTMLKNIEDFGAQLPLCRARGILRPRESYSWQGGRIDRANWDQVTSDDGDDMEGVSDANNANEADSALSA
ncbi:hypothetical protein BOTBODRAFT_181355 [Botryobasidium botryosum FD-172 SS1]|uniref:F-box domain-containing protein n=1 Tax=Botryobasidium botryosum (strain FD-172 SS1) TaxID=930990 RepID=A0A067LWM7_BOTB1|nr:hypothetical protein BOTBODRAFT_181355 [Botryobasidium botryosum FD-172 SS1]